MKLRSFEKPISLRMLLCRAQRFLEFFFILNTASIKVIAVNEMMRWTRIGWDEIRRTVWTLERVESVEWPLKDAEFQNAIQFERWIFKAKWTILRLLPTKYKIVTNKKKIRKNRKKNEKVQKLKWHFGNKTKIKALTIDFKWKSANIENYQWKNSPQKTFGHPQKLLTHPKTVAKKQNFSSVLPEQLIPLQRKDFFLK